MLDNSRDVGRRMTPQADERMSKARLRNLAKARRVRARKASERRSAVLANGIAFRAWIEREHAAFDAHVMAPADRALQSAWLKVLRERPELYGRREAA
jgi:hypothetical protein